MRKLFWVALSLWASIASADVIQPPMVKPNLVMVTSLDPSLYPNIFFLKWYYAHYTQYLENDFRNGLKNTGYNLVIENNIDRFGLYRVLHDPSNVGVFWVSHAAPVSWNAKPGVALDPLLVDYERDDVKDLLKEVHPNLRWLSIIGCKSDVIMDWVKQQPETDLDSDLDVYSFSQLVDAQKGLKQAMQASREVIEKPEVKNGYSMKCDPVQGHTILVTRTMNAPADAKSDTIFRAVSVEVDKRVVGVFPESKLPPGSQVILRQNIDVEMPQTLKSASDLKITIDSGANAASVPPTFDLGEFHIYADTGNEDWKVFAMSCTPEIIAKEIAEGIKTPCKLEDNGKPYNPVSHLYHYTGPMTLASPAKSFEKFECANVGPANN